MKTPNEDLPDPNDDDQNPRPPIDQSQNADETNAFEVPLEDTVHPSNTNTPADPDETAINNDQNPNQTLDFTVSQSSKYHINIPGYELISELGRGAMGVVYKARQVRADRIVALKLMINLERARPQDIKRFTVEAQSSARLHHPNIIQVYEVGQSGQSPYFTQEFASGGTLAKKISKQLLSHVDTARMMLCLANAVAYAHSRQIVHRDLKPLNILLDEHGEPKVADFGLARRMEDQSHLTQDGTILGTPSYMAPEQASGNSNAIGPLSDVYALGAILYELLTGRPPFKGATVWEVIQQVRSADPAPPSQLQSGLPADLETICLKCLQKDPARRYESAKHLAEDIQRHINNEPILARPVGQWERLVRLCKRNPREARLVGLVAGLLACFAVVATFTAFRINQDRKQITTQRDEISGQKDKIEKQRDEISKEKIVSDNRLTLYRNTVSKMVNRVPRLLEDAPLGSGTRQELMSLIGGVLSESNETESVGSSQKWGRMAVALREGEIFSSRAAVRKPGYVDSDADAELAQAAERFEEAEQIAEEVYQSTEPDRARAAANLATVKIKVAATIFDRDNTAWRQSVPIYKRSIELRREALEAELAADSDRVALRQSELANELQRYASFLFRIDSTNPKFVEKAMADLKEAESLLTQSLSGVLKQPELEENIRYTLALTLSTIADIAKQSEDDAIARKAFEDIIALYNALIAKAPYRFSFLKNRYRSATDYGDYLLMRRADPALIEQQYRLAMDSLKKMLQTPEAKELEYTGLGTGYYRIGLAMLRQNKPIEANLAFRHCESLRAKAYYDRMDELDENKKAKGLVPFRIDWMIVQARLGLTEPTLASAKELIAIANSATEADGESGPMSIFKQTAASLGMLSSTQIQTNPSAASKSQRQAMDLLEKAIAAGYRDLEYLRTDPDFDWLQNEPLMKQAETMINNAKSPETPETIAKP